jgi:hypothetical protein
MTIIDKSTIKIPDAMIALAMSWCSSEHYRGSRRRCVGNRKLSETRMSMSFVAKPMEISNAGIDERFTDRINLTFPSYSPQE